MLVETVVLAAIGGAAGLVGEQITLALLTSYQLPGDIPIANLDLRVSSAVVAATGVIALAAGLLFGAAPAWRASRADVGAALRDTTRAASARSRVRSALVAAQIALSLVLLAGSGLFLRSLVNAVNTPLGFDSRGVVTASVNVALAGYDQSRAAVFYRTVLERARSM